MRGRPELRDRFFGTLLIAVGATIVAAGAAFAALGDLPGSRSTLVAGISLMFRGFLRASRPVPCAAPVRSRVQAAGAQAACQATCRAPTARAAGSTVTQQLRSALGSTATEDDDAVLRGKSPPYVVPSPGHEPDAVHGARGGAGTPVPVE